MAVDFRSYSFQGADGGERRLARAEEPEENERSILDEWQSG